MITRLLKIEEALLRVFVPIAVEFNLTPTETLSILCGMAAKVAWRDGVNIDEAVRQIRGAYKMFVTTEKT